MNDLKFAIRQLLRNPGFTAVAVLTLALGLGANTALFSVVHRVLLKPLAYPKPNQLVMVWATDQETRRVRDSTSFPDFTDWKEQNQTFAHLAAYSVRPFNLAGGDQPERLIGLRASADLFPVLGLAPSLGRSFSTREQQPGQNRVVLVSDSLWKRRFKADPHLIGQTVTLDDEIHTVIGILPSEFQFPPYSPLGNTELVVPFAPNLDRGSGYLFVVGRLKGDVSLEKAQAEMTAITRRLEQGHPATNKGRGINLVPLQEAFTGTFRPAFLLLTGTVGILLLIACSNVANLMLARGIGRQKEFVVRAALGATRRRILQQLFIESAVLAVIGGIVALAFTRWGANLLVTLLSQYIPVKQVSVERVVLGFALLLSLLTVPIFGLAPALALSRHNLQASLKEGSHTTTRTVRHNRLQSGLVIVQTALALTLLTSAGLLMKSFLVLGRVSPGFPTENLLTADLPLAPKYSRPEPRERFLGEVLSRLQALAGVESAALVSDLPFKGGTHETFSIEGQPDPDPRRGHPAEFNVISPGYFHTLRIPVEAGRAFEPQDTRKAPGVAIINAAMRRRFWPREDPVGKRIRLYYDPDRLMNEAKPEVFLSCFQDTQPLPMTCVLRTRSDPKALASAVEQSVWSVDKDQPVSDIRTMEAIRFQSIAQPRVLLLLVAAFTGVALLLAVVGIYSMISYSVKCCVREVGIRMAFGATRQNILNSVVFQGLRLALLGVVAGTAGAFALARLLARFLYGVGPNDPVAFFGLPLLFLLITLVACYLPARRATQIDPMEALRQV